MADTNGDFSARTTAAYATTGLALDLGRGVLGGTTRTKTLQLMAEQLSAIGVPRVRS